MSEQEKSARGIIVPLVVDGAILLLGAYQLGKINTTLETLADKLSPITDARMSIMEQQLRTIDKRLDAMDARDLEISRELGLVKRNPR